MLATLYHLICNAHITRVYLVANLFDVALELLAADANLVASGVSKDATCEQLKEFIESKGVKVTEIELISNAPERRTNTFRVAIKAADYDKAMQPEVWPCRVGV